MGITAYSTTAGSNTAISGTSVAENCPIANWNNAFRQMQADQRTQWNDAIWFQYGDGDAAATVSYASATSFTVAGVDVSATYHAGRRVKIVAATPGTIYGTISSSSFSTDTTVNVTFDSGSLSNEALTVYLSIIPAINRADILASATLAGAVELATTAEVVTGTDTARASTPAGVAAAAIYQGVHTISVPAGAMKARTTLGAAAGVTETTTNKIMVSTFDFDKDADEFVQFIVPMPKSWNEGTVTAIVGWTASGGSGDVVWGVQAVALSNDDALDAAFGTAQTVTDTLTATGDLCVTSATSAITIAGTPAAEDTVVFQVYRDANAVADTHSADAKLVWVKILYTIDAKNDA